MDASFSGAPLTQHLQLSDNKCYGEEVLEGDKMAEIVRDRKMLGVNIKEDDLIMNSSYLMLLKPRK